MAMSDNAQYQKARLLMVQIRRLERKPKPLSAKDAANLARKKEAQRLVVREHYTVNGVCVLDLPPVKESK